MEIVDDPILSEAEISTVIQSLGGDLYGEKDIRLFTDIIHSGFADPYNYDKIYSDFLVSYFGLDKEFVSQSASVIVKERVFQKMFDGRGSDEEYHTEVLKWNIDNLGLRFSFSDFESLEYAIQRINTIYGFSLPQPQQNFYEYWNELHFPNTGKAILQGNSYGEILISDKSNANEVISILNKIDYQFKKVGQ
jgi:hypothetical protein